MLELLAGWVGMVCGRCRAGGFYVAALQPPEEQSSQRVLPLGAKLVQLQPDVLLCPHADSDMVASGRGCWLWVWAWVCESVEPRE
jgi:hypothetical protein